MEKEIEKQPLDEVMLAMDVVDTMRHQEMLVERELHAEDRDRKMMARLREIYASQGIEVPDHVLKEGVAALKEERFVYKPPSRGIGTALAGLYIARGKWGKRLGAAALALSLLWGGFHMVMVAPAERRLAKQATALNAEIRGAEDRIGSLEQDAARLQAALPSKPSGIPKSLVETFTTQRKIGEQALASARELTVSARNLVLKPDIKGKDYKREGPSAQGRLKEKEELIAAAAGQVERTEGALATILALQHLPGELAAQRDAAVAVAKVDSARKQAAEDYESGMAALRAGDLDGATAAAASLKAMREALEREYEIRVVSRPKEYSGVWRVPEANPKARNYYIVVEAVDSDGKPLSLPITSEEDGRTRQVDKWALRVDLHVFQRVSADKQDDGIIQNRRVGVKKRGHLEPEYLVATTGEAITDW